MDKKIFHIGVIVLLLVGLTISGRANASDLACNECSEKLCNDCKSFGSSKVLKEKELAYKTKLIEKINTMLSKSKEAKRQINGNQELVRLLMEKQALELEISSLEKSLLVKCQSCNK
jgi:hypothetical protein